MRDEERTMHDTDLSVWRGILFGIGLGVVMWAGILGLIWYLLFH